MKIVINADFGGFGLSNEAIELYLKKKGLPIAVPDNYYPYNQDTELPMFNWCSYAHLFYSNWLNYVYQETPYDLRELHPLYN